jgi:hypothetical protein
MCVEEVGEGVEEAAVRKGRCTGQAGMQGASSCPGQGVHGAAAPYTCMRAAPRQFKHKGSRSAPAVAVPTSRQALAPTTPCSKPTCRAASG